MSPEHCKRFPMIRELKPQRMGSCCEVCRSAATSDFAGGLFWASGVSTRPMKQLTAGSGWGIEGQMQKL